MYTYFLFLISLIQSFYYYYYYYYYFKYIDSRHPFSNGDFTYNMLLHIVWVILYCFKSGLITNPQHTDTHATPMNLKRLRNEIDTILYFILYTYVS